MKDWDAWFLGLADYMATGSKDPSTKVGAVIVRPDRTIAGEGFNGFPRGIADDCRMHDRPTKYELVIHAEMNATLNAAGPVAGCTIYVSPVAPCVRCAVHLVQAGIVRVVSRGRHARLGDAGPVFAEAGVVFEIAGGAERPLRRLAGERGL